MRRLTDIVLILTAAAVITSCAPTDYVVREPERNGPTGKEIMQQANGINETKMYASLDSAKDIVDGVNPHSSIEHMKVQMGNLQSHIDKAKAFASYLSPDMQKYISSVATQLKQQYCHPFFENALSEAKMIREQVSDLRESARDLGNVFMDPSIVSAAIKNEDLERVNNKTEICYNTLNILPPGELIQKTINARFERGYHNE
jgi:hypothetical protein